MSGRSSAIHEGVSCDGCLRGNFSGNRFKCLRCYDFDLCQACFNRKQYSDPSSAPVGDHIPLTHMEDHPMQMMMTRRDFDAVYEGDVTKNYDTCKITSFTCPYCGTSGHSIKNFVAHIGSHGSQTEGNVLCPLCIALPEFDSNREVPDLKIHITEMHSQPDAAQYRTEPTARTTTRRPMLARRAQRQPAGQAGTFATATPSVGMAAPFGWTTDMGDVDEMFRMVNLNRVPNMQRLQDLSASLGQGGAGGNTTEMQRIGQSLFQQLQQENQLLRTGGVHGRAAPAAGRPSNLPRSMNEYAQPRPQQNTAARPNAVAPVARTLSVTPIYPPVEPESTSFRNQAFSPDDLEPYDDLSEADTGSGDEVPPLENVTQEEGESLETPPSSNDDMSANMTSSKGKKCKWADEVQPGGSDSEFEFDPKETENNSSEDELDSIPMPAATAVNPISPEQTVTRTDILKNLKKNLTAEEYSTIKSALRREDSQLDSDGDDSSDSERTLNQEEGADQQNWTTVQFDVPPMYSFGMGAYWNDKRFLRQRKFHRDLSTTSTMEDTVKKTEAVLAFLRRAVPELPADCRLYDKPDRTLRRAFRGAEAQETVPVATTMEAEEETVAEREDVLGEVSRRLESESELSPASPPEVPATVAGEEQEIQQPSDGDSSDEEDERSIRQDDVEFLADQEIRQ